MADSSNGGLPSEETTVMIVWPSIGATGLGRWIGRLGANRTGFAGIFTVGNLLALVTIPFSLVVFFWQLLPVVARRYRLTDRRIIIQKGLRPADDRAADLDAFDTVEVEVLPGQAWLRCGDLVFRQGDAVVFRLAGVPTPESFRRTCLSVQDAQRSVHAVLEQQKARAEQPAAS